MFAKVHKTEDEIEAMLDGDDDEKGFAYEAIMGLKENIDFCLKNKLDMVVFAISEKIKNQLFRNS